MSVHFNDWPMPSSNSDNPVCRRLPKSDFICHSLDRTHFFFVGALLETLAFTRLQFEELWKEHPSEFHEIMIHGRLVKTPRWQQAFGKDYHYSGNVNRARPVLRLLEPLLLWCQDVIDERLNGILLNWYDGAQGHYIGAHRDSMTNMHSDAPIVTVSLGHTRVFRLRPWKGKGMRDFLAEDGTMFVMPFATNQAWTHEVPKGKQIQDRRISITVRAFE